MKNFIMLVAVAVFGISLTGCEKGDVKALTEESREQVRHEGVLAAETIKHEGAKIAIQKQVAKRDTEVAIATVVKTETDKGLSKLRAAKDDAVSEVRAASKPAPAPAPAPASEPPK